MSAQIITALRKRADALDEEADQMIAETGGADTPSDERGCFRSVGPIRFLADEFRALADQAEAR